MWFFFIVFPFRQKKNLIETKLGRMFWSSCWPLPNTHTQKLVFIQKSLFFISFCLLPEWSQSNHTHTHHGPWISVCVCVVPKYMNRSQLCLQWAKKCRNYETFIIIVFAMMIIVANYKKWREKNLRQWQMPYTFWVV